MFLRILKNDLKRKKTMNCILLLFVILSAVFAASSVNNIITVMNGIDYYFDKAGMTDYIIIASEPEGSEPLSKLLDKENCITNYKKEQLIEATSEVFTRDGKMLNDFGVGTIMSIDEAKLNYFDSENNIITKVEQGKVYISGEMPEKAKLEPGDTFKMTLGETEMTFEFVGAAKDAFLDTTGTPRFFINNADFEKLSKDSAAKDSMSSAYYINTNDTDALDEAITKFDNVNSSHSVTLLKTAYFMDMLVAAMMLILGICLILVSFVVLRFTIGFTIVEEFREIGVMKAVGIKNSAIRMLYLVKYLGIAVIGAVIGFFASFPFGNMLIASASKRIVLGNDNSVIIGILCSIAVVIIILSFCWGCTRQIKKLSPIDAVRSGQTGERFSKKSVMHLGKSRLGSTGFLSLNDVTSAPKQYGIITAVFTICILLVMILAITANTISGKNLLYLFGLIESDVYYLGDTKSIVEVTKGTKTREEVIRDLENTLKDNDMPGRVFFEELYLLPFSVGDKQKSLTFQICRDTKASDYIYSEGTAPQYENEIALGTGAAERFGVKIGDTVKLRISGEEKEYVVTALFKSMFNLGEIGRLHESVDLPESDTTGYFAYQINFDDNPDSEVIEERVKKLKDIFDSELVYDTVGYCRDSTGVAATVISVKYLVLTLALIIIIMISVLMERSFISREKAEIALMKAVGFRSSAIIAQHTLRFVIVGVFASVIAAAICLPATKLVIGPVFASLGASGMSFEIAPFETFAVYPAIVLAATLAGTFFTALYTKTIKASDTADIE